MNGNEITQEIKAKLSQIEQHENIRILYACESGSRAWGFASPDSDYDVRFVYLRPREFYLKLENTRDTLECELNEIFDISGWDIQKLLRLLNRSNPSIFEWAVSPIVYKTTEEWNFVMQIFRNHFSETKALYHYNSITKNNLRRYFNDKREVKYKPYLYNLRQCLSCEWILDRKSPPPIVFDILKDQYLPEELHDSVNKLIEQKKSIGEKETGPRIKEIDLYIDSVVSKVEKYLAKKNLLLSPTGEALFFLAGIQLLTNFLLQNHLLPLAKEEKTTVSLTELANPYSSNICRHILQEKRQATNPSSTFLEACDSFNQNKLSHEELISRHHPLRETIINQTGKTEQTRAAFL